ncbi:odorant receptor 85b-like [Teleopsis dalmanni]|uniref:odorant receptor 85b-like n=1 Tax=Teleopsis dalmanni TaxID=139649 RepID=UPI0018CE4BA7|nr:odorant receptor 85b-like [Teleopsis dalmanni]
MNLAKFDDFVRLSNFFYKTVGIKPYEKPDTIKTSSFLQNFVFYAGTLNLVIALMGEFLYVLIAFKNGTNFAEATMTMSYIGFVSVGLFKMLSIWWKKDVLTAFVRELLAIFPNTAQRQEQYKLNSYLRQCTFVTVGFSLLYMILIWTYNLFAMVQYLVYERWLQLRFVGRMLPYYLYIPWNYEDNWSYYLLYAALNFAGYTSASGQIAADLLLCATATQVLMHYDFISNCIEQHKINTKNSGKDMLFLKDIIAYHEKLLNLSDMMNDVFGVPLLFNFMTSTFVLCFVGFQMTIGVSPDMLFKLFLFLFSSTAQIYLICYYGQKLMDASMGVARAVYNQNWYSADVRYKKMLVLIAKRAQKPALLKATVFINISNGTMADIFQMSYKFFALLRTMYSK